MFLTSSLAAVMSLVWFTSPIFMRTAYSRTRFRNGTTSCSRTTTISSLDSDIIIVGVFFFPRGIFPGDHRLQQFHAFFDIKGRPDAGERQAEFHEGDRYGGLHSNDDGFCIQYLG